MILSENFYDNVRGLLGVDDLDLSNDDIDNARVAKKAEIVVKKLLPDWETITDEDDKFMLEDATVNYVCFLLCPSMKRRVETEVKTLDTVWKKDKVDWDTLREIFLSNFEEYMLELGAITFSGDTVGLIRHEYDPIGGV